MGKGANFEREICRTLSLWWTNGSRDDVFWRSAASGARAKIRSYTGKKTFGQYGDIQATDPIGQPLIDLCTIELKRGYKNCSVADVLDAGESHAKQKWTEWVEQALTDHQNAGSLFWALITKRDRRETLIFIPKAFFRVLVGKLHPALPKVKISCRIKNESTAKTIYGIQLNFFLESITPETIINIRERK